MTLQISQEQRQAALIMVAMAAALTVACMIDGTLKKAPDPNITCEMSAPDNQEGPPFSTVPSPIRKISVSGFIDDPFEKTLFDFEGTAVVSSDDKSVSRLVWGSIFLDDSNKVEALALYLGTEPYSSNSLSLTTLDSEGMLNSNREALFAHEEVPLKMSYPMKYRCTIDRERLGLSAEDQRTQDLLDDYLPMLSNAN